MSGLASKYKVCASCDKRIQMDDATCWNCGSADFRPLAVPQPEMPEATRDNSLTSQLESLREFHHWFTKKELDHLPEVLHQGELVKALTSGRYQGNTWLIAVTDQRILFLDKGMVFGLKQFDLPLHQISSLSHQLGLVFGTLHIATSGFHCVVENIPKDELARVAAIISAQVRNTHAPDAATAQDTVDVASQLERLAALRQKGVLTEEEFVAQKAKILSEEG